MAAARRRRRGRSRVDLSALCGPASPQRKRGRLEWLRMNPASVTVKEVLRWGFLTRLAPSRKAVPFLSTMPSGLWVSDNDIRDPRGGSPRTLGGDASHDPRRCERRATRRQAAARRDLRRRPRVPTVRRRRGRRRSAGPAHRHRDPLSRATDRCAGIDDRVSVSLWFGSWRARAAAGLDGSASLFRTETGPTARAHARRTTGAGVRRAATEAGAGPRSTDRRRAAITNEVTSSFAFSRPACGFECYTAQCRGGARPTGADAFAGERRAESPA